jgi:hypothetical protein
MDVLKNKSYKQYETMSRYSPFPYYYHSLDDRFTYGMDAYLKDDTPYQTYYVQRGDTLDSIALKFYNSPTKYWIICSFNRIRNPYITLVEGQAIKVPSISSIEFKY